MIARSVPLQLGLEDLLGDLHHARRSLDLGRLAWLAYCEVRRWARMAGEEALAEHSSGLITHTPCASREAFLAEIDELIFELEQARQRGLAPANGTATAASTGGNASAAVALH